MDDSALRERLWLGFARLQMLLGGQAARGSVVERPGLVASVVPSAPDSPTLNAAVLLEPRVDREALAELEARYREAKVRRWGVWVDGSATAATDALKAAGLRPTTSSPGMGAVIDELPLNGQAQAGPADLATVGHVNDLAYGNQDGRLERTLAPMPADLLRAYRADVGGEPASVALALDHDGDCGVSFVATAPQLRRQGHARRVMQRVLVDARDRGLTTTTLQATDLGERLYHALGYRYLSEMQLWEQRS